MSDASSDEFLAEVIEDFGLEGYARWWIILETIASQMDKTGKCSVTYSWVKWQSLLKGKRNKLRTFLEHLENESKLKLKQNGNKLEISCPKLLKLRDNYTQDCQVPEQEPIPPDSNQEVEVEVDLNLSLGAGEASRGPPVLIGSAAVLADPAPPVPIRQMPVTLARTGAYPMTSDWKPDPECLKALCLGMLVDQSLVTSPALFEFRNFWSGKGYCDSDRGWVGKLLGRIRDQAARAPKPANDTQGFLEKHTDASWREGLLGPKDVV